MTLSDSDNSQVLGLSCRLDVRMEDSCKLHVLDSQRQFKEQQRETNCIIDMNSRPLLTLLRLAATMLHTSAQPLGTASSLQALVMWLPAGTEPTADGLPLGPAQMAASCAS